MPRDSRETKPPRFARVFLVPGVLLALLALFHGGVVWGSLVLCGGDLVNQDLPWRAYWTAHGPLTGWFGSSFSGYPFFANIQAGVLYPPNWLYFIGLPVERTASWLVLAHLMLGGWGFYRLARLRLETAGALVAAGLWMCGGYQMLRLTNGVVIFTQTLAWLPWVWWAAERCGPRNPRATAQLALFGALQILAGSPQLVHITWGGLGIWMLVRVLSLAGARARLRTAGHFLAAGVLAALIAFPQLAATAEMASLAAGRGGEPDWEYLTDGSLEPRVLLTDVFPELFDAGNREDTYWGSQAGYLEMNAYTGVGALLLALFAAGLLAGRIARPEEDDACAPKAPERRWLLALALLFATGLLVALGRFTPLYRLLFAVVPGFDMFRVPARWQVWCVGPVCLLAGWGAQLLLNARTGDEEAERRPLLAWLGAAAGLLVVFALVRSLLPAILSAAGFDRLPVAAVPELHGQLYRTAANSVTWAIGVCFAAGAVGLALLKGRLAPRAGFALVCGVLLLDLLRFWQPFRPPVPPEAVGADLPSEAPYHRIAAADFRERFFPETPLIAELQARANGRFVFTDDLIGYQFDQNTRELSGERPALHGLCQMRGYQPLQLAAYASEFAELLPAEANAAIHRSSSLTLPVLASREPLDAYNATVVLSYLPALDPGYAEDFEALGLRRATRLPYGLELWENPHAPGWAWLSNDPEWPGLGDHLASALLENMERTPDELRFTIDAPEPGLTLHFAEIDYPGWRIEVREAGEAKLMFAGEGRSVTLPRAGRFDIARVLRLPVATRWSLGPSALLALAAATVAFGMLGKRDR
ncbi:MAG: hypothetical protein PWP23_766 [Candidatus Sumerlaeota bacterium]|nr:hypothetical protein [Candidatus Sumerlaeota bacterium]